jgi:hypothetical protein
MEHTIIRNGKLFCLHCGGEFELKTPVQIKEMEKKINAFNLLHKYCEKTWIEPKADQNKNMEERAYWWLSNGETGLSSKTMWRFFMNQPTFGNDHPHDPDDFKRCYKLLKAIPEWKNELHKLKSISKAWNNLVDNWDKLTTMYEQNVKENWKNYKKIGMYEFMQTLIA